MADLSSRSTTGNMGFLPGGSSGSSLDSSSGGFDWGTVAKAGIGLAASAFAPKTQNINPEVATIESQAAGLNAQGKKLAGLGTDALSPVLKYFQSLASGNPADVLGATAPDRARVIDQYDAARKSIQMSAPRGGGQASATTALKGKEASDLAAQPAAAREKGAEALASLGTDLTKTGLTAEQASTQAMASVLAPILNQAQSDQGNIFKTFAGIALPIAGAIFGGPAGFAAGSAAGGAISKM